MRFGRNPTEEHFFLVSVSYKEVLGSSVCDVNLGHVVREISARFLP